MTALGWVLPPAGQSLILGDEASGRGIRAESVSVGVAWVMETGAELMGRSRLPAEP